jgi:hypothetical protein
VLGLCPRVGFVELASAYAPGYLDVARSGSRAYVSELGSISHRGAVLRQPGAGLSPHYSVASSDQTIIFAIFLGFLRYADAVWKHLVGATSIKAVRE